MNFRTQSLDINPDNPFESDPFGRQLFANKLNSMLKASGGITVFVHSPWGHGKSTFIEQWKAELLRTDKAQIAVLNAFSKDHVEDGFTVFLAEIKALIKKVVEEENPSALETGAEQKVSSRFKKVMNVAGKIAVSAAKQTGKRYIGEYVENLGNPVVEDFVNETAQEIGDQSEESIHQWFDARLEEVSKEESLIVRFRKLLEDMAITFGEANNDFPLTIVVDELDRCRPDFALNLLEKIKHFFDVPNVCFVLVTDKNQLAQHVAHAYGLRSDNLGYISKFGDVFCELPRATSAQQSSNSAYYRIVDEWLKKVVGKYENTSCNIEFKNYLTILVSHNQIPIRDVISMVKIGMLKMESRGGQQFNGTDLAIFSYLVVYHGQRVHSLLAGDSSEAERMRWRQALGLDNLDEGYLDYILHCLFDDDYDEKIGNGFNRGNGQPQQVFEWRKKALIGKLSDFSCFYEA